MDRLKAMATFVGIIDAGSLTAAAEALGQSTATVTRTLAALERHLGARLLNRTTRRLALTDEGAEYLAWSRRVLGEFDEIERRFDARSRTPGGLLRLTAPVELGQRHLAPLIDAFLLAHPSMRVELTLSDRVVDLLEDGLDLAVRVGRLVDSSMVAVPLGRTRQVVCAGPAFLQDVEPVLHPASLSEHPCIVFAPWGRSWEFAADGGPLTVDTAPRLVTNQVPVARRACLDAVGVGRLLHYQVADELADGRLVRLLEAFEMPDVPIQLVYPHARLLAPRVRAFIDWMTPRLAESVPDPAT